MKVGFNANYYTRTITPPPRYSTTFGKTNLGKTSVMRQGEEVSLNFVEYSLKNKDDAGKIEHLESVWGEKAKYISEIAGDFRLYGEGRIKKSDTPSRFFALEDSRGKVLAIAEISPRDTDYFCKQRKNVRLDYIQVAPEEMYISNRKSYSGLGKALVGEIIKNTEATDAEIIEIIDNNSRFWGHSGLFKQPDKNNRPYVKHLSREDFSGYIKYAHT